MTKDEIQARLEAKPFVPFVVRVAGGKDILVPSRDHAHIHPRGRTMHIFLDRGGSEIVDIALVSSIFSEEAA